MAEWSKPDLGSSLSGGVGSNPTAANTFFFKFQSNFCAVEQLVEDLGTTIFGWNELGVNEEHKCCSQTNL